MPIQQAAAVLGLTPKVILRRVSDGHASTYHRVAGKMGFLLPLAALVRDDPELGNFIVPNRDQMPLSAVAYAAHGLLTVPTNIFVAVASALLTYVEPVVLMFDEPNGDKYVGFVPDEAVKLTLDNVEVSAHEME